MSFIKITDKLIKFSTAAHASTFDSFDWPETIDEDQYWFSPNALSIAGTEFEGELSEQQKIKLSKWECINSFSMNTVGERELIHSVTRIMDEMPLGEAKEYLYHLINEENQHMWYFQKFCTLYAGKVYGSKSMPTEAKKISRSLDHFMVFARILLFEEIGHYYNIINSKDEQVHTFVREINQAHYNDEARHITYGRRLLSVLAKEALHTEEDVEYANAELAKTLIVNYNALFNPSMYRDAGLARPMSIRSKLIESSERQSIYKNKMLKSVTRAFDACGISLAFPGGNS
jgi:hypothetical protein